MPYLLDVSEDKSIHFGRWVQWERLRKGFSRDEFSQRIGVTERQLAKIEAEPQPASYERTLLAIAQGLGLATDEMMDRWRAEPVGMPPRKFRGKKLDRADLSAAARLLRGESVMLAELESVAKQRGIGLGELFREIGREWLAAHGGTPAPTSSGAAAGDSVTWEHPDGTQEQRRPFPPDGAEVPARQRKTAAARKGRSRAAGRAAKRGSPAGAPK
jgi:transcriptional regulator with XRE-family HTH domain